MFLGYLLFLKLTIQIPLSLNQMFRKFQVFYHLLILILNFWHLPFLRSNPYFVISLFELLKGLKNELFFCYPAYLIWKSFVYLKIKLSFTMKIMDIC